MGALFPQKSAACGYGQFDPQLDAPAVEKHIDQRESGGRLSRTQAVQDQGKFIAADAAADTAFPEGILQKLSGEADREVPFFMAVPVIDNL